MRGFQDEAYALMRMVTGFLFLWHGAQKLLSYPLEAHPAPEHITYVAGPIELVGGVFVCIGLWTRPAAFLCSGLMAFAYWMAHGREALLPLVNGGELAALYCFVFLYIWAYGSGKWSVDRARS